MNKKVYILVLNWNGWEDTIECLESLQCLEYENYQIVVVDNGSTDSSVEKIINWAQGELEVTSKFLKYSRKNKPIKVIQYNKDEAELGGNPEREQELNWFGPDRRIVIIQSGANRGFAGGNNVGIRYVMAKGDADYIWLLNNDTVVKPDSLNYLVGRMQEDETIGMCGSTLLYYYKPNVVQGLGGKYNKYLALPKHIGEGTDVSIIAELSQQKIEQKLDYVIGASMMVSRIFVEEIGLMCEDYFLYFEELDWATRARRRYRMGYAKNSIIYHKEGATIKLSNKSEFYSFKNRILFTQKYYPCYLISVYTSISLICIKRYREKRDITPIIYALKRSSR